MPGGRQSTIVLGLDTCGAEASLALGRLTVNGMELVGEAVLAARTAGALLTSALRDLLAAAGLKPADLQAVAVVRGPGSFTGMRIGVSAAKALSEAAGVPLIAISRLAVLAAMSGAKYAALDAGRGNLYLRVEWGQTHGESSAEAGLPARLRFTRDGTSGGNGMGDAGGAVGGRSTKFDFILKNSESADERMLTPGEFESLLLDLPGLAICEPKLHAQYPAARLCPAPTAMDALRFARSRIAAGDWDDTATLDALYLWRTEQMLMPGTASGTVTGTPSGAAR